MSRHHNRAAGRRYARVRGAVLERDDYTCQTEGCHQTATQIHHIHQVHQGGAMYDPSNLVALCGRCHRALHDTRPAAVKEWDDYVREKLQCTT